jgi:signal transduction histidine kinase
MAQSSSTRGQSATGGVHKRFWWIAGALLSVAVVIGLLSSSLLLGGPQPIADWLWLAAPPLIAGALCSLVRQLDPFAGTALRTAILGTGVVVLVVVVYLLVVVGLGEPVATGERNLLGLSMLAAGVIALLVLPLRAQLDVVSRRLTARAGRRPAEVLDQLRTRMTRSVPMDELVLSLAEQLRETLDCDAVEVYTGAAGELSLRVAVPHTVHPTLSISDRERVVIARMRVGATAWAQIWLPRLVVPGQTVRIAPLAHQGELLGLIVVRAAEAAVFSEDEEALLAELARQFGLALHNVQLDSALQQSLVELEKRNSELRASQLRIVSASNETRRMIERNLHDGAQQHLVALAVKIGLVEQILDSGELSEATGMLRELRGDVKAAVQEVRELAHGIYPPLLRDKGLPEALRAAATRSALPVTVQADGMERHPADLEAAVYFCCVEALQNAGKYAGNGATVAVTLRDGDGRLTFEIADDGAGFAADDDTVARGHGFTNMLDRMGALGGTLTVKSQPSLGATVTGSIPLEPAQLEASV